MDYSTIQRKLIKELVLLRTTRRELTERLKTVRVGCGEVVLINPETVVRVVEEINRNYQSEE